MVHICVSAHIPWCWTLTGAAVSLSLRWQVSLNGAFILKFKKFLNLQNECSSSETKQTMKSRGHSHRLYIYAIWILNWQCQFHLPPLINHILDYKDSYTAGDAQPRVNSVSLTLISSGRSSGFPYRMTSTDYSPLLSWGAISSHTSVKHMY